MSRHLGLRRSRAAAVTAATIALATGAGLGAASASAAPTARAAKTVTVTENANLELVRKSGSTLYEAGTATGTLNGPVRARFEVSLIKVTGTVTISARGGGTLTFTIVGYPRSAGTVARFGGNLTITGGTGRFSDARGSGTFEGVVNRRTWDATVNATGRLTY